MRLILIAVMFLLVSCNSISNTAGNLMLGHFEYAHKSDLKAGMSLEGAKRVIQISPSSSYTFPAPDDPKKSMIALQFEDALQEYEGHGKHWVLFENDKLVAEGLGTTREAELYWYISYYDYLRDNSKLSGADSERKKYQKMQQLYSITSYENEYFTYRILLASKLDKKEIDGDTANYLLAQKKSEIDAKLEVARQNAIAQQQTQQMIDLQRTGLFLQSMANMQQSLQTKQPAFNRLSCTTNQFGSTWNTTCY